MSDGEKKLKEELLKLVQEVIQKDQSTREEFQVGDKFRFVRDRLRALEAKLQESIAQVDVETEKRTVKILEDEISVYVYIYNAQGIAFPTWQKMVNPSVFYEYSVNRPIYAEEAEVLSFIRSRPNKPQHGYLNFVIKKQDILPLGVDEKPSQDANGTTLLKIKEGSLRTEKLIWFKHQDQIYVLNPLGQLVKKVDEEA